MTEILLKRRKTLFNIQYSFNLEESRICRLGKVNSLLNNKILDLSILKAFTDDKINVTENVKSIVERVENIVEKGENAGYQHFLLFPLCFQKALSSRLLKVEIAWERVKKQNSFVN